MALRAAPTPIEAQRPSLRVVGGRKTDSRTRIGDLEMDLVAAGQEMKAMATRITNALAANDAHSAMHFAGRLWTLGHTYTDPEGDAA